MLRVGERVQTEQPPILALRQLRSLLFGGRFGALTEHAAARTVDPASDVLRLAATAADEIVRQIAARREGDEAAENQLETLAVLMAALNIAVRSEHDDVRKGVRDLLTRESGHAERMLGAIRAVSHTLENIDQRLRRLEKVPQPAPATGGQPATKSAAPAVAPAPVAPKPAADARPAQPPPAKPAPPPAGEAAKMPVQPDIPQFLKAGRGDTEMGTDEAGRGEADPIRVEADPTRVEARLERAMDQIARMLTAQRTGRF